MPEKVTSHSRRLSGANRTPPPNRTVAGEDPALDSALRELKGNYIDDYTDGLEADHEKSNRGSRKVRPQNRSLRGAEKYPVGQDCDV
jgi:hypothetical protein